MKAAFTKQDFNQDFNHSEKVKNDFLALGFTNTKVDVCLTNGCSIYVKLDVQVLNENKLYASMFVWENETDIVVRISDHNSGLDRCGGVSGNNMTMGAFLKLIETGAIESKN